ncbi:metallophosphoesterase family protein [Sporosarcina gallistercoris]|uniref:Serine/threonine protein phosphatase n=1 Tax=Sporosarcina gallistercoris TaxID=2762245 RepID=A0ABR8PI65_9BACL|nr:metallophosphoesterase family protein [Sporosarcina gallistercoris]MBD7907865.1 serine/threonine protein phosphatase [Sporosarcina gallistercoris]
MKRTLVISDIHGELGMLTALLEKVSYNSKKDRLFLLGDYIDRGTDSKATLDKVMELVEGGAVALKGNHEDMMIQSLIDGNERTWRNWTGRNGGEATLQSYGFEPESFLFSDEEEFQKPHLHSDQLNRHLEFIQNLPYYIEEEDTIFIHAGVKPGVPLEETDPYELIWIRDEFHNNYKGPKTVIFGHTPTRGFRDDENDHSIYFGANSIIGIDGGAVFGGQLNCLVLPEKKAYYVQAKK